MDPFAPRKKGKGKRPAPPALHPKIKGPRKPEKLVVYGSQSAKEATGAMDDPRGCGF